jgi:hypothetical protein
MANDNLSLLIASHAGDAKTVKKLLEDGDCDPIFSMTAQS